MRVIFALVLLLPTWALAQTPAQRAAYQSCDEHRNVRVTPSGKRHPAPGFVTGWDKCVAFVAAYDQMLRDAATATNAAAAAAKAARDATAQEELNK